MKKLLEFFDHERFFKDKLLKVTNLKLWEEPETLQKLGKRFELGVAVDKTKYSDDNITNEMEKLFVKIPSNAADSIKLGDFVRIVNPIKISVYGKFNENLSITAENLQEVNVKQP